MKKLLWLLLLSTAWANTPGQHSVWLWWTQTNPSGITWNVYRGTTTGVCTGTPTPYKTGITILPTQAAPWIDTAVTAGQVYFYAVSAVKGGESACSPEAQLAVPSAPETPGLPQGTTQ